MLSKDKCAGWSSRSWSKANGGRARVPEQPLAPGAVGGRDAHRRIDREAAAVFPFRHRLRGIARQRAAAHENAQQPLAHGLLDPRDGDGIDPSCGMEDHTVRRRGLEHAVDDHAVKVQMRIECRMPIRLAQVAPISCVTALSPSVSRAWVCGRVRVDPCASCAAPGRRCRAPRTQVPDIQRGDKYGAPPDTTHGVSLRQPDRHGVSSRSGG